MDEVDKWLEEMEFLLSKQGQEIQEFIEAIDKQSKINKLFKRSAKSSLYKRYTKRSNKKR